MKNFFYRLETFGLILFEKIVLIIGLRSATFIFGTLFMCLGIFTPPTFLAIKNIKMAMPEINFFKRIKIIIGMWNNLGKSLVEFVCLNDKNVGKYLEVDEASMKIIEKMREEKIGTILFTAHFGNWELFPKLLKHFDLSPFFAVFRPLNNPFANEIMVKYREKNIKTIPKGPQGTMKMYRCLKNGGKILMLVDQRFGNDAEIPFFNIKSQTSTATATFALKYGYKVYSAVIYRKGFSSKFKLYFETFTPIKTENLEADIIATTEKINKKFEEWIRKRPELWFWVHNRWKNINN
jgi:KDO2-lipid IV(A) lauroyltransferase